jgi:predicted MFS family arabinose efflux permease
VVTSSLSSAAFFAVIGLLSIALVMALVRWTSRQGPDLKLLRVPGSRWVVVATLLAFGANFYFFTSLFMQYRYDESVIKIAVMLSAPEMGAILGCFISGWAAGRWGAPRTAAVALAVAGLAQLTPSLSVPRSVRSLRS